MVRGIDAVWAVDLSDMQYYAKDNDSHRFILAVIDVFSKFGWMRALKSKSGTEVADALNDIITSSGRKPTHVWSDKGTEFYNEHVKKLVELISTENEEKSCVVERWNRTEKDRMFKYFTANNTLRYVDVLDDMVTQYNNTKHSSIKMTPVQASTPENLYELVW
jgi:transposase InsO family protein